MREYINIYGKYFLLLLSLVLSSCFSRSIIPVEVVKAKPSEINVLPYKTLKVEGTDPRSKQIKKILQEQMIISKMFNLTEDEKDAEAMIWISSKESFDGSEVTKKPIIRVKENKGEDWRDPGEIRFANKDQYVRYNKISMNIEFKVVNALKNETVAIKTYTPNAIIEQKKIGEAPEMMDPEPEYEKTIYYVVANFMGTIRPTTTSEIVHIEKVNHAQFEDAVVLAREGKWEQASRIFDTIKMAMQDSDKNIRSKNYYNYALALQYSSHRIDDPIQQLEQALQNFRDAYNLSPEQLYKKQEESCSLEIKRLEKLRSANKN